MKYNLPNFTHFGIIFAPVRGHNGVTNHLTHYRSYMYWLGLARPVI